MEISSFLPGVQTATDLVESGAGAALRKGREMVGRSVGQAVEGVQKVTRAAALGLFLAAGLVAYVAITKSGPDDSAGPIRRSR